MKKIFLLIALFASSLAQAQTPVVFHPVVKVEYEKVVYTRQLMKELYPEWFDRFKDHIPEKTISYFDLVGDSSRSLYKPGKEGPIDRNSFFGPENGKNVVYNDYRAGTTVMQKPVFEETFLVSDSLLNIKWKLTADTRSIAGFECRKAVGILDDTVAVFAFYTDEILISGGPESVHGLPGLILGMGIPRLHATWFATKVEVNGVNLSVIKPATKGKKVNRQSMIESIEKVLRNWGPQGRNMLINFSI